MEQLPEDNSEQVDAGGTQGATLGSLLREAREKLGFSVADVAGQIKFAPRQIEALEADDYKQLPEEAFLRGFVRSYAKILRLDAQALLAYMPNSKPTAAELVPPSVGVPFPNAHSLHQQNMIWLVAASLLAVIVAVFAFLHYKAPLNQSKVTQVEAPVALPEESKSNAEPLVLKSSTIEPAVPAAPKARPAAKETPARETPVREMKDASSVRETKAQSSVRAAKTLSTKAATELKEQNTGTPVDTLLQAAELRLVFGEESWTEIRDKDGNILSSQINPAGSELHVEGIPPFSMLIGHAASASLYYQGKQVDLKPYINQYSEVAHLKLK